MKTVRTTPATVLTVCPSCSSKQDAACETCSDCGWSFNRDVSVVPIVRGLTRPKQIAALDLAVTVDRTGSSDKFKDGIPMAFAKIVENAAKQVADMRIFLYSHGDLDEGQDVILHTDGGSPEQAINDIKSIPFGGGGSPHEHHLDAIEYLMNQVPWSSQPGKWRSAIVGFMTQDSKPCRSGISARELGEEIKNRKILLHLVCEPTYTLYKLAKAADGLIFPISNSPASAELQTMVSQLTASMTGSLDANDTEPISGNKPITMP